MAEFDLLKKTELRLENLTLNKANLNDVAFVVAEVLGIEKESVLVVDVQNQTLDIDLLNQTNIDPYHLVGKKKALFEKLNQVPGVEITEKTRICSQGILGWIALDKSRAKKALDRSLDMVLEIKDNIAKRAMVFSTGTEVINGDIEDTNTPHIAARLKKAGYWVTKGPTLPDDVDFIAARIMEAVDRGFGLIVTTGGVGAESKDCTVEALFQLDSQTAAPYICKFEQGKGRHVKAGVRIGAAKVNGSLIVALPGPNDEVRVGLEALLKGLKAGLDQAGLAENIASGLITKLKHSMSGEKPQHACCRHGG